MLVSHNGIGGPIITLVGRPDKRWKVEQVTWSFDAAPTNGNLSITGLDQDDFDIDITAGGPGGLALPRSSYGKVGSDVIVTVACDPGVAAKANVFCMLE